MAAKQLEQRVERFRRVRRAKQVILRHCRGGKATPEGAVDTDLVTQAFAYVVRNFVKQ
jgi:hypothetical protein